MKVPRTLALAVLLVTGSLVATRNGGVIAAKPEAAAEASHDVAVEFTQNGDLSAWRYTLTKKTADAKDLGHFILDLATCEGQSPTAADIVSATVDGIDWSSNLETTDGKNGCAAGSANIVKFDNLPAADTLVIELSLRGVFPPMDAAVWLKSGPSCNKTLVLGPGCRGYTRTSTMMADPSLVGELYSGVNSYMRRFGFDYSEHPNCTGGFGGHMDGVHGTVDNDATLGRYVFRFDIHIDPVIDGDRCSSGTVDRQRNEMKSITNNTTWAHVQGNYDEWQILEWKFKLPVGLQPTTSFFHIHQLKPQDGPNNGAPTITITPRSSSSGGNKRIQIIHSVDGRPTDKGTIVDNVPLSEFEGEWVQVRQEMHYTYEGYYGIKITRLRDGKVLIDHKDDNIDMWRIGTSYVRSKFGLYRSLGNGRLNRTPVGQNPLLKNESIWIDDFRVYEKNTNPSPTTPH